MRPLPAGWGELSAPQTTLGLHPAEFYVSRDTGRLLQVALAALAAIAFVLASQLQPCHAHCFLGIKTYMSWDPPFPRVWASLRQLRRIQALGDYLAAEIQRVRFIADPSKVVHN
jgi:hypothetical protein